MKIQALTRPGLCLSLVVAAAGAWGQASSEAAPPKVPPESLSIPSQGSGLSDTVITAPHPLNRHPGGVRVHHVHRIQS